MTSELYKLEGAGNDFVLGFGRWADALAGQPDLVRRLCDRRRGIGADGTLALEVLAEDRVRVVYRNADGGRADFCANGTRCAARAAVEFLGCAPQLIVETDWAAIPAAVIGVEVSLDLPPPSQASETREIVAGEGLSDLRLLTVGVPHVVAAADRLAEIDLGLVSPPIRHHPTLGSDGANVNLYQVCAGGSVSVRSYERGIEGETLSCGSGLVAVALVVMADRGTDRVELVPLSGDRLVVEALGQPPVCATRFTGPARVIAAIEPSAELVGES